MSSLSLSFAAALDALPVTGTFCMGTSRFVAIGQGRCQVGNVIRIGEHDAVIVGLSADRLTVQPKGSREQFSRPISIQ